jgi:hypothetical protein
MTTDAGIVGAVIAGTMEISKRKAQGNTPRGVYRFGRWAEDRSRRQFPGTTVTCEECTSPGPATVGANAEADKSAVLCRAVNIAGGVQHQTSPWRCAVRESPEAIQDALVAARIHFDRRKDELCEVAV